MDRTALEDMNPVKHTLKISQINGELTLASTNSFYKWITTAAHLPCSCPSCMRYQLCGTWMYAHERIINYETV